MKKLKTNVIAILFIAIGSLLSTPMRADTQINVLDTTQFQTALEAFGLSVQEAEQAVAASITLIKENQSPQNQEREEELVVTNLLDMSPY